MRLSKMLMQKKQISYWLNANRTDSAEMAASDAAAIAVFKANGLCAHDDYMTVEEAAAVTQLPGFSTSIEGYDKTKLIDWDWSALSGMYNTSLYRTFNGCKNLCFTELPVNFGSVATDMDQTFYGCTNLALTKLPEGFGQVATGMNNLFNRCTHLSIASLPDFFGHKCKSYNYSFFGCTNISISVLNSHFSDSATSLGRCFQQCKKIGERINDDVVFDLGSNNFGKHCSNFTAMFDQTGVTKFLGAFDFSAINADMVEANSIYRFCGATTKDIRFAQNTMKFSFDNANAYLSNINNESLLSLAECLFDFGSQQNNKIWTVTSAQKTILDTEMYDDTRTYTQYCEDKGWTVTTE